MFAEQHVPDLLARVPGLAGFERVTGRRQLQRIVEDGRTGSLTAREGSHRGRSRSPRSVAFGSALSVHAAYMPSSNQHMIAARAEGREPVARSAGVRFDSQQLMPASRRERISRIAELGPREYPPTSR